MQLTHVKYIRSKWTDDNLTWITTTTHTCTHASQQALSSHFSIFIWLILSGSLVRLFYVLSSDSRCVSVSVCVMRYQMWFNICIIQLSTFAIPYTTCELEISVVNVEVCVCMSRVEMMENERNGRCEYERKYCTTHCVSLFIVCAESISKHIANKIAREKENQNEMHIIVNLKQSYMNRNILYTSELMPFHFHSHQPPL